ncbi:hypothetical protein [Rickettsia sp.]
MKGSYYVIPWLDHGIHKTTQTMYRFSIFNWIPWSSHGMTLKTNE